MGLVRESHGRIAIESRRESFIIHPDYGYRDARMKRSKLMPGDHFRELDSDRVRYVRSIDTTKIYLRGQAGAEPVTLPRDQEEVIPCGADGVAYSREEDPEQGSFGEHWRASSHPEFGLEDLPDLIAALIDLLDNPR